MATMRLTALLHAPLTSWPALARPVLHRVGMKRASANLRRFTVKPAPFKTRVAKAARQFAPAAKHPVRAARRPPGTLTPPAASDWPSFTSRTPPNPLAKKTKSLPRAPSPYPNPRRPRRPPSLHPQTRHADRSLEGHRDPCQTNPNTIAPRLGRLAPRPIHF